MQAVINLSGEATRLRPLSCEKCAGMLKITEKTVIEENLIQLKNMGVTSFLIIGGYMGKAAEEHVLKAEPKLDIQFVQGDGTDSALKENSEFLEQRFIYFSKPLYTRADLKRLVKYHEEKKAFVTVLLHKGGQGSFRCNKEGRVTKIAERRMWGSFSEDKAGTGIYVMEKEVVRYMPQNASVELNEGVLSAIIRAGKNVYAAFEKDSGECITDFASYMRSCAFHLDKKRDDAEKGIFIEEGAVIDKGALLEGPCFIGKGAHIKKGASVGKYSIIHENAIVSEGVSLKRCILNKNCRIGKNSALRGCILDENVKTGKGCNIFEQAVIGKSCILEDECKICSFVKIWPEKTIDAKMTVSENIMWGQKKRTKLFEEGKIKGVVNLDITPSVLMKIGLCIGKMTDMGSVGVSTDGSPCAQMLRDSLISSLLATGCNVLDFGEQPVAITRRAVVFYALSFGVAINVSEIEGEDCAEISLILKNGIDMSDDLKKKMEDIYLNEESFFPESKNVKECEYAFEYKLYYLKSLLGKVTAEKMDYRVLLSCSATWGRRLITSALSDMGASVRVFSPSVKSEKEAGLFEKAVSDGFDIGFITDERCERVTIVTPKHKIIKRQLYELISAYLIMKTYPKATVFVPLSASGAVEKLAQRESCRVSRATEDDTVMMEILSEEKEENEAQFVLRFDGVGAIIKLMDFIYREGKSLDEIIDTLPEVNMVSERVEIKEGRMEEALKDVLTIEGAEDNREGVKISFDKGWVLVIPDRYKDFCHVTGEGYSMETAKELCDFCIKKLKGR